MPKLFTKIEPNKELDVSDSEALDLERMGLVHKTNATTEEGRRRAAERAGAPGDEKKES